MALSTIAAVATMLAVAAPAHPASSITLTLRADSGATTSVTLECDPPGGSHPQAARTCRTLASVHGDFGRLPAEQIMCPMIYAPVTATAYGHWHARPVAFHHEYANRCVANAQTASVFDFS
ncbi:SSI family serine proteinase inhibitor [Amycolatopsis sp. GM8]|uniref:SSI family serine proteinase inhibitor n=1 Tax=Amycolatopsis sp. GM8 TaxID=2896530 RepID=UPI001F1CD7F5|nr:SSI family serine proteinase inhibitor [Amycolatopsis sp. GM8]